MLKSRVGIGAVARRLRGASFQIATLGRVADAMPSALDKVSIGAPAVSAATPPPRRRRSPSGPRATPAPLTNRLLPGEQRNNRRGGMQNGSDARTRLRWRDAMTTNSRIRSKTELNNVDLNLVVGGLSWTVGSSWAPPPTPAKPPTVNVSAIQPIHLAPLPPLHTAVPHL